MSSTTLAPARVTAIPGYTLGTPQSARSPLSDQEFADIKTTLLLSDADLDHLRLAHAVLQDQIEDVLDVWYGFVGGNPHLVRYFAGSTGAPDGAYLAAVRKRFGAWILDTTAARYDRAWLDYQYEIGLRHTTAKKNKTDQADSVPLVNFRYLSALTIPITTTLKPFLAKKGASAADVDRMHAAWVKSVLMQTILWSHPYIKDGEF